VSILKTLETLIETLRKSEAYQECLRLKRAIEADEELLDAYDELLKQQQALVRSRHAAPGNISAEEADYEARRERLLSQPTIAAYLEARRELAQTVRLMKKLIEDALALDDAP